MTNINTELTTLAVSVFRNSSGLRSNAPEWVSVTTNDPVLNGAYSSFKFITPSDELTAPVVGLIQSDPEFASIATRKGEFDPMLIP